MAKCFLTGVEVPLEEAYVLDVTAVRRLIRDLRARTSTLERLVAELGSMDRVEVHDPKTGETHGRKDRRLVSESVAAALSISSPEKQIFLLWKVWRSQRMTWSIVPGKGKKIASAAGRQSASSSD